MSRRTAHRLVGCFEEAAVRSQARYLAEVAAGRAANMPAPAMARQYQQLVDGATLRGVIPAQRAAEASHCDANHRLASQLAAPSMAAVRVAQGRR